MENLYVDVWQADLSIAVKSLNSIVHYLDQSEADKALTFKFALMRDRYLAVRALSRQILARYLPENPSELQFAYGENGKPALVGQKLHFNLSHSGDQLLVAVANFPNIGVDIEELKPRTNLQGLAKRCFSDQEFQAWQALSTEKSRDVFFSLWTKKEAFVKAVGRGIALGLDQCEVDCNSDGQLLQVPVDQGNAGDWKVTELRVVAGYSAALVTPRCEYALRLLQWQSMQAA